MEGVALQTEGGQEPESVGPLGQRLRPVRQLQNQGVPTVAHQGVLHVPGEAVGRKPLK